MAATNIPFDRSNQHGQELKACLNGIRKAVTDLPILLGIFTHMVDGDGTDVSHFTELVTLGVYENTADAKASWDELQSVNAKLQTDGSVMSVNAAMLQVCEKHGIV